MSSQMRVILAAMVFLFCVTFLSMPVLAQEPNPTVDNQNIVELLAALLEALGVTINIEVLVGLPTLVTVIINILKQIKNKNGQPLIPDGYGGLCVLIGDIIIVAIAAVAGQVDFDLMSIDGILLTIARIVTYVAVMFGVSLVTHRAGRAGQLPTFGERNDKI